MDKLEFLDGSPEPEDEVQAETAEPTPEPAAEPQPEASPRDEHGRFVAKEPPPPKEEAPSAPQPEVKPEPKEEPIMVPLAALHETRDKVKDLEGRLSKYEQPQRQPEPVEVPDPELDPVGFANFQSQQFEAQRYQDRLFFSERIARIQHGDEAFEKMRDWGVRKCDEDPHFNLRVRQSQDPYSIVAAEYQRDQIATKVTPSEFEQFQAWKAAQAQLDPPKPQAAPAATPATPAPTPSIASAPSAGGVQHQAVGPGVAFDETIR